jgi:pyruvate dehydrogenase E1 component alpha subunit
MNRVEPVEISRELALEMFRRMVLIRQFEDRLYQLFLQGLVPGTLHQYQGQEAIAAGVCCALRKDDMVLSTHRPVGHAIAKGVSLERIAAEMWGKATGCAGGKGGQMHLGDREVSMPPSNAIVGANIPIATGAAIGFMLQGSDRVAVSFFGDGASNTGGFHEGINLAAVKNAPVIFVCENNEYAASTHISLNLKIENIAQRADSYGIPGKTVDGMDAQAVYLSAKEAVERARRGEGPTLLEYKTYRYMGHSRGDPGGYRNKEEVEARKQEDPLARQRKVLAEQYDFSEEDLAAIEERCRVEVEQAIEFALTSPEPGVEELTTHVFAG